MTVAKVCVREVDIAAADESVWQAAERMHQRCVGTLVVVNDDRHPVGIVTDRDLVEKVIASNLDYHHTTVGQVMTFEPEVVREDESIQTAIGRMRSGRFRRLPVVDQEGCLVGLLSLDDILMLLSEEIAEIGKLLDRETPRALAEGH